MRDDAFNVHTARLLITEIIK